MLLVYLPELHGAYNASIIQNSGRKVRRRILSHPDFETGVYVEFNGLLEIVMGRRENGNHFTR